MVMAARLACRKQSIMKLFTQAMYSRTCAAALNNARCLHMGEHFTRGNVNEIELQTPVPLSGRKYLVSSTSPGFPKYLSGPRQDFPLLVKAVDGQNATMKHWAMRCREVIDEAYLRYEQDRTAVAILFRGLPNRNEKDFAEWVNNLGFEPFSYVGGISPRYEIQPNVAEGARDDKVISIEPHNEMAYSASFPKIFTISCFKKAAWGGETAISDTRDIHAKLDPGYVEKCEEKKIRYWNCLHDKDSEKNLYQSWQMRFKTEYKARVNEFLKNENYSYSWDGDTLFYWKNLSPSTTHVKSGEYLWFNMIAALHGSYYADMPCHENLKLDNKEYPCHSTYGDGEEIESYLIDEHRRCTWESAVGFHWENGDILFIDQLIVQHSRLSFEGERNVGVSLLDY